MLYEAVFEKKSGELSGDASEKEKGSWHDSVHGWNCSFHSSILAIGCYGGRNNGP